MSFSVTTSSRKMLHCKISTFKSLTAWPVLRKCHTRPFLWWKKMPQKKQKDDFSEHFFFFLINNFLVQEKKKNKSQKRTGRTTLHLLYKRTFSKRLCTLFTTMSNSIIITLVFTTSILLHFMLSFQISLIKEVGVCFRQVKKYAAPLQYWNHYTKHSSYIYHINYHLVTIHLKRSNV